jgi:haloacetate dehalogenase
MGQGRWPGQPAGGLPAPGPRHRAERGGGILHWTLGRWGTGIDAFAPEALAEYERCFRQPAAIHASCEDCPAAASIDLAHDESDLERRIQCPLLALWGKRGLMERHFDVLATWREKAAGPVSGRALDCGHFLPEEHPQETAQELLAFFGA